MGIKYEKLFDSELKVMDVLWDEGDVEARHVAERMISVPFLRG